MIKNRKRDEITVAELYKKLNIVDVFGGFFAILFGIFMFAILLNLGNNQMNNWENIGIVCLVIAIIVNAKQKNKLEKAIKIQVIKSCAEFGILKETAYIHSEEILDEILKDFIESNSENGERVNKLIVQNQNAVKKIQLEISVENFLCMLDLETKINMVKGIIKEMKIEHSLLVLEYVNDKSYCKTISEDDMFEMFEYIV